MTIRFEGRRSEIICFSGADLRRLREGHRLSQKGLANRLKAAGITRIFGWKTSQVAISFFECCKEKCVPVADFRLISDTMAGVFSEKKMDKSL